MKTFLINFILFFYIEYIVEDWNVIKPFAKPIIYPFWFINTTIMWIISPLFIVEYFWVKSDMYKELQKINEQFLNN